MSVDHIAATGPADLQGRNWDSLQFRLIFAVSFVVYLVAAIGVRFTPHHWRSDTAHRSIFSEAWEASGTTAQIAFAG